jgi:hypothetical protein
MTAAIAKSKATEVLEVLVEVLGQLTTNGIEPGQFVLAGMKRDAKSAISAAPEHAFIALGIIAAMEWDEALVHKYFNNSIAIAANPIVHSNYTAALQLIGRHSLAAAQACEASELAPTDLTMLKEAIDAATHAGKFEDAQALCVKLESRALHLDAKYSQIADACRILKAKNTNPNYTENCNIIAYALLQENRIRSPEWQLNVDLDDQMIFSYILIDLPFEQVYELDRQLARRLIDELPDILPSSYWIGFDCANKMMPKHEH